MSDTVIKVENLSKKYIIRHQQAQQYSALRDVIADWVKSIGRRLTGAKQDSSAGSTKEEFWALKDVSFEVKQGDRIGIIGRNGAGKSTLLKILSRIVEPTEGEIVLNGRVASLLEVGTGFHPELTGRENIYLNGAILGMSRLEIGKKFDEIVDFAEIDRFLDTPVKRYSSGMYVRLAFAVAAHLETEILIIDEVLAVGDIKFQEKCLGKMGEVAKQGKTILLVSHNISSIQALCSSAILLTSGTLSYEGSTQSAISKYLDWKNSLKKENLFSNTPIALIDLKSYAIDGTESCSFTNGEDIHLEWEFLLNKPMTLSFCIAIEREGFLISCINTYHQNHKLANLKAGKHIVGLNLPKYTLNPGQHILGLNISDQLGENLYLEEKNMLFLSIQDDQIRRGDYFHAPWPGAFSIIPEIIVKSFS
jgi:lipopolysaccharide transport system ATP-binding protein